LGSVSEDQGDGFAYPLHGGAGDDADGVARGAYPVESVQVGGAAWAALRGWHPGLAAASAARRSARPWPPYDEIFHPSAHKSHFEIQVLEERELPRPTPDDH